MTSGHKMHAKGQAGLLAEGFVGEHLALDLSGSELGLFRRRAGGEWTRLAVVPLQLGVIGPGLDQLYERARGLNTGQLEVEVWLPVDQITLPGATIPKPGGGPQGMIRDAHDPQGAQLSTEIFAETAGFLAPHGFKVIRCTTREIPAGADRAPVFEAPGGALLARPAALGVRGAGPLRPVLATGTLVVAALAIAGFVLLPRPDGTPGTGLRTAQSVQQVALAPGETVAFAIRPLDPGPDAATHAGDSLTAVADPAQILRPRGLAVDGTAPPAQPSARVAVALPRVRLSDALPIVPGSQDRLARAALPDLGGVGTDAPAVLRSLPQTRIAALSLAEDGLGVLPAPIAPVAQASPRRAGPPTADLGTAPAPALAPDLSAVRSPARLARQPLSAAPVLVLSATSDPTAIRLPGPGAAQSPAETVKLAALFAPSPVTPVRFDAPPPATRPSQAPIPGLTRAPVLDLRAQVARFDLELPALDGARAPRPAPIRLAQATQATSDVPVIQPAPRAAVTITAAPPDIVPPPRVRPDTGTPITGTPDIAPPQAAAEAVAAALDQPAAPVFERLIAARPDIVPPLRPRVTAAPEPETGPAPTVVPSIAETVEDAPPENAPGILTETETATAALADPIPPGPASPTEAAADPTPEPSTARVIAARPDIIPPLRPRADPAPSAEGETLAAADTPDTTQAEAPGPVDLSAVTITAARPDIVPPARPRPDPPEAAPQPLPATADAGDTAQDTVTQEVDALVVAAALAAEEDLSPSPNALRSSTVPPRRTAEITAAEAERVATLAALAPSERALSATFRPADRPANLVARVSPAPAATAPAAAAPIVAVPVAPAPTTPRETRPQIPTSASVARAATIQNAIPMRQMVLIGVYGTSGSRHALLRLSSGRYQKVEPGDTVDGYRVSAISPDAIRLRRGGRDTLLVIPE